MKLVQSLASVVAGVVILATVGSGSASAAEFNLSGTFASTDEFGSTGLANGSFNGTYSYSGNALPAGSSEVLSSFSINLLNASNVVVDTFSSNNANETGSILYGASSSVPNDLTATFLDFHTIDDSQDLQFAFPNDFLGVGNLETNTQVPSIYVYPSGIRDFQRINYSKKKKRQVDLKNDNHFKGEKRACRRQALFSPSFMQEESIHLLSALKLNSVNKGYFVAK